MPFVKIAQILASTFLILVVLIQPALAQTSIGFENPEDTTNILEYRLPDWGYRTWDLGFDLSGNGGDAYRGDINSTAYNRFRTGLNSRFNLYRESESRTYKLFVDGTGNYDKAHQSGYSQESSGHQLNGRFLLGGNWTRFLGDGPFSLRAVGNTFQTYSESIQEKRIDQTIEEIRQFQRTNNYYASLGAGVGRIRDVTPLIRAQRLSERLTALGREQLAPGQVREIARVLATEQGYRAVFDRPDRSFWRDVLEPMLDPDQPLSPYEVFYLRDIMEEDVGPRGEGFEIRASVFYSDHRQGVTSEYNRSIARGSALDLRWVRNLTFDHQLTLSADADYSRASRSVSSSDYVTGGIDFAHLWTIADRYRWDTSLGLNGAYEELASDDERRIQRNLETALQSVFTIFIENNLSLNLRVRGSNSQEYSDYVYLGYNERYYRRWNWSYGIGLEYFLDRFLY